MTSTLIITAPARGAGRLGGRAFMADQPDDLTDRPVVIDMADTEAMSIGFVDEIIVSTLQRGAVHLTLQGPTASISEHITAVLERRPGIAHLVVVTPYTAPLVAVDGCSCSCHRPGGMTSNHVAACCGNSPHTGIVDATPTH